MEDLELIGKAKELVERKRKIIRAGTDLLIKTGGAYSDEDRRIANELGEESHRIFIEREKLLKEAWDKLDTEAVIILEFDYLNAVKEEVRKSQDQIQKVFRKNKEDEEDKDKE